MRSGAATENGASRKGNNEAFDLFCYAHAVAILRGYEKSETGSSRLPGRHLRTQIRTLLTGTPGERGVKKRYPLVHLRLPSPSRPAHCLAAGWGQW